MKKIIYCFILLSVFILSLASSCNKPEPKPELPTDENTMYYYVDGRLYIPESDLTTNAIVYSICDLENPTFDISAKNIIFHFHEGIQNTGSIQLMQSYYDTCQIEENHAFFHTNELGEDGVYHSIAYYTHDGSGYVNISYLSEDKRKFKGTFEMTVYHENTNIEKHITDGHFNINLDTLNE